MEQEFKETILKIVKNKCKQIRKPKYSPEYYLDNIILLLTDLQKWQSLRLLHTTKSKFHYKTIQKQHLKWSKLDVYKLTKSY